MLYSKVEDEMELKKDKLVRFNLKDIQNPVNYDKVVRPKEGNFDKLGGPLAGSSKVLPEDHIPWEKGIFDPGSDFVLEWNRVFLVSCLVALAVDPLYFYLPSVGYGSNETSCIKLDQNLAVIATFFRTIADVFYLLHMVMKFRTAYVSPSSRVLGRGELVMNRKRIAMRYLKSDFLVDLMATLPLPQIIIWIVIPMAKSSNAGYNNNTLAMIIFFQYIPRLYLIFPLSNKIIKATGVVTKTAWAGAAYNLLLYLLASHVLGASWYLLSIERQNICWKTECRMEFLNQTSPQCHLQYLDCAFLNPEKEIWTKSTSVFKNCDANDDDITFQFGIFGDAMSKGVVSVNFLEKYLYCLWWGLQNLSSYGQNLETTTFIGETTFAIVIAILGLVLFAHLIGNMQAYMQSITVRLEEWRLKRRDTEEWMSHRQLPPRLRNRVRKFNQYKWLATRGVNEESILQSLPSDLRRDIQRHLCLDLVRRVPYFSQMDDQLLDAICERLVSSLSTEGTYIVREGDPVSEMFFIIRGRLESSTTGGGRTGFFDSITLRPGAFCGEELLSWALLPKSSVNLPTSTRTVRALVEVEAFALSAEDLRFVSNQFRRLHSKKLQHTFRFYSPHWRTWATCFIQAAWRRYKRRKLAKEGLRSHDSLSYRSDEGADDVHYGEEEHETFSAANPSNNLGNIGVTFLASKFAAQTRKGAQKAKTDEMLKLQKPEEPDFSVDDENDDHGL